MEWYWWAILTGLIFPLVMGGRTREMLRTAFEERGPFGFTAVWIGSAFLPTLVILLIFYLTDRFLLG